MAVVMAITGKTVKKQGCFGGARLRPYGTLTGPPEVR